MPLRNVATTFTIEQQRLEINNLAGDVNNIATGVTNVGTAATANALAAGATGADLTLSGTLTVNGTQTILNTATLEVEDKNIVIAKGSSTDAAASGGGITLKGADDKTISYNQTGDKWESNKDFEAPNLIGTAITVNGNLNIADKIRHLADTNTSIRFPAADTVTVETGGTERLRITDSGLKVIGKVLFDTDNFIECNNIADTMEFTLGNVLVGEFGTSSFKLLDTFRLKLGTGNDLQMYHDNNSSLNLITAANNQEIKISDLKTTFYDYTGVSKYGEIGPDGVRDSKGSLRDIPKNSSNSQVTIGTTHAGEVVATNSGGWDIPTGVMSPGNTVTLLNDHSGDLPITTNLTILYNTADGTRIEGSTLNLGTRGMATIYFWSANAAYIQASSLTVS